MIDLSVPSLERLHERRSKKWSIHSADVLSATIAEMDYPLAPPIAEALHLAIARDDLGYPPPTPVSLKHSFARFAARRLGWTVDEEQVVLVPDVMYALTELCRVIARPVFSVAVATPAYPPYLSELRAAGAQLIEFGFRGDGSCDLLGLDKALSAGARALLLSSPHNPTGRVFAREELIAIAERCADRGVWVLADEVHAPLTLPGATHTPWLELSDAARRWGIALTSASKAFNLAGLKAALIVTASGAACDVVRRLPSSHEHAGLFGVIAAEAAFDYGDAWLDAVIEQLDRNREQLTRDLARRLCEVSWAPPQAGYLAWLNCQALRLGEEPAQVFLTVGRVALSRGLDYGRTWADHVRLNFATSPEHLSDAIARMEITARNCANSEE